MTTEPLPKELKDCNNAKIGVFAESLFGDDWTDELVFERRTND